MIWRMKGAIGNVIPPYNDNDLRFGNVGVSYCYKNKGILFDENKTGEDFAFLTKILTDNYIITPEIFYKVGH